MLSPDSIARIIAAGSNVRISGLSPDSLRRLAALAKEHDVTLEIVGSYSPETCVQVAAIGGKNVTFNLSD